MPNWLSMSESNERVGFHLLAVDDEEMARHLFDRIFGFEPDIRLSVAMRAQDAIDIMQQEPIDVLISDQRLDERSGLDLVSFCQELYPDSIRIIVTAYPDLASVIRAVNEGQVYRYMPKPCDPDDLLITVRRALEAQTYRRRAESLARLYESGGANGEDLLVKVCAAYEMALNAGVTPAALRELRARLGDMLPDSLRREIMAATVSSAAPAPRSL